MYKVVLRFPDGEIVELDELCETEAEAEAYGSEALSNYHLGTEILHDHNPGDYPPGEEDDGEVEVIEV